MFSFFKSKPFLKDLIPADFVDIHSHLLFGIDDGAQTPEDTKFIIKSMKELGFNKAITTPHTTPYVWDNTKEIILSKYDEVLRTLPDEANSLQLRVASEYMMDGSFFDRISSEKLLTLKANYVLVEMSYINPPIQLFDILYELKSNGYQIVLAHPERYNFYHQNLDMYKKLKKFGCLFQLNLLSTVGYYGEHVTNVAKYLLESDMIDFTGSDIHNIKHIKSFESKLRIKDEKPFIEALSKNIFFDS